MLAFAVLILSLKALYHSFLEIFSLKKTQLFQLPVKGVISNALSKKLECTAFLELPSIAVNEVMFYN